MKITPPPRIRSTIACLVFALTITGCQQPASGTPTFIATIEGEEVYTPIVSFPPGTAILPTAELVTIEELVANPERYDGKFIEVHGVNEGSYMVSPDACWINPSWSWSLGAGPLVLDGNHQYPPDIYIKNDFDFITTTVVDEITNGEQRTVQDPYGKRAAVWGWWRLFTGRYTCPIANPITNDLYTPGVARHWYLDAVQLQFLEDIRVTYYQPIFSVYLSDGKLYLGEDSTLTFLDASNPSDLVEIGQVPTGGMVVGLKVIDRRAYVLYARTNNAGGGLQVFDVGDLAQSALVGSLLLEGSPSNISVEGLFAYVANYELGLQIIDIRDPANPTLRGVYTPPGSASSVQVVDQLAYLTDSAPASGLKIIDVSDPDHPALIGTYPLEEGGQDVQVVDNIAYLAGIKDAIYILDVSDPSQPTLRGIYQHIGDYRNLYVADNLAYLITDRELSVIDLSNPTSPSLRGTSYLMEGMNIQMMDNIAYVATWNRGLQVLDISDPNYPVPLDTYGVPLP